LGCFEDFMEFLNEVDKIKRKSRKNEETATTDLSGKIVIDEQI
jgi:hypothetical protein